MGRRENHFQDVLRVYKCQTHHKTTALRLMYSFFVCALLAGTRRILWTRNKYYKIQILSSPYRAASVFDFFSFISHRAERQMS